MFVDYVASLHLQRATCRKMFSGKLLSVPAPPPPSPPVAGLQLLQLLLVRGGVGGEFAENCQ